ncbi:MAG: DUF1080 domain-containing protein [Planctomycetes bacterium]|nr:DUF1080 domain-containing protein [Planctomycetota bacterium]
MTATAHTALLLALLALLVGGCATPTPTEPWTELFDGRTLGAFASTRFGGEGEVAVRDGELRLGIGSPMTGITWQGTPPSGAYELEVEAARVTGTDFFCGLTFPVRDAWLTLVLGGWGGAVSGLSSLDGNDAARNETRTLRHFETGRVYRVTVRVDDRRVAVAIDGEPFLAADITDRELSLRPEVELSRPLGIATFVTAARIRTVRWRPL